MSIIFIITKREVNYDHYFKGPPKPYNTSAYFDTIDPFTMDINKSYHFLTYKDAEEMIMVMKKGIYQIDKIYIQ